MVTEPDLIWLFIEPFEELEIPYMITGGVASVIYGDPRFTRDIDVVLEEEAARPQGGHFNLIHGETALRADVYLMGDDPLHAWAFARRERVPLEGMAIWVALIEYVILRKLEYFRASGSDRHLRDVAMMLRISGDSVDQLELERWIDELDLREAIQKAPRYEP